ncbi:hypothetical protein [Vibrio tapetis]|uniref:Uncharacterized protein n=1 Tax=Vibrio tapetis subsp. tapetis TaxID=1671868 RepID=A0A2N8ZM64_9VIBR|nr:hypothetical protein [Vibrio tapetis]SON52987.1 conserved exported protein of unknown function [Vibrio tapetis subsp. tapetis]
MRLALTLLAFIPTLSWANSEINAYAYEGLSEICMSSRMITKPVEFQEMKAIYLDKKQTRQASFPSNPSFAFFASKQLWNIRLGDHPTFEQCAAILR